MIKFIIKITNNEIYMWLYERFYDLLLSVVSIIKTTKYTIIVLLYYTFYLSCSVIKYNIIVIFWRKMMLNTLSLLSYICAIGFLTAWIGILIGFILCYLTKDNGEKFRGTVLGFLGGIMIAIICFDIIPESFEGSNEFIGTLGILLGLIVAFLLDGFLSHKHSSNVFNKNQHYIKIATFIAIGTGIHNMPSGIALGSLLITSHAKGIQLSMALLLHTIPEGLTIGMYLKQGKSSLFAIILFSVFIAFPMSAGTLIGGLISRSSSSITSLSLSFAAGLILYTICKEILPESIGLWKGRLLAISTVLGILLGRIFISVIH